MNRPDTHPTRREALIAGAAALIGPSAFAADAYPSKPIRLILPNAPGSSADKVARTLSGPFGSQLGQPLVIENIAGSGGLIGLQQLLRAPRDGYTLGQVTSNFAVLPNMSNLPFDPRRDIVPVAMLVSGPFVLVTHPSLPVKTLADFVKLAKSRPADKLVSMGSPGIGTSFHLAGELLGQMAGFKFLHVPYKGAGGYTTDLLSGTVECGFLTPSLAMSYVKAGKLRPIATTSETRSAQLPDVPTIPELGYAQYDVEGWQALVVAAGTPAPVIQRVNADINRVLKSPAVRKAMEEEGHEVLGGTPEFAEKLFGRDFERFGKLAKLIGIKPES